jgi:hypothetical protein
VSNITIDILQVVDVIWGEDFQARNVTTNAH